MCEANQEEECKERTELVRFETEPSATGFIISLLPEPASPRNSIDPGALSGVSILSDCDASAIPRLNLLAVHGVPSRSLRYATTHITARATRQYHYHCH